MFRVASNFICNPSLNRPCKNAQAKSGYSATFNNCVDNVTFNRKKALLLLIPFLLLTACVVLIHSVPFLREFLPRREESFINLHIEPESSSGEKLNHSYTPSEKEAPSSPSSLCLLIGTNPADYDLWQFNSRSLCLSSLCVGKNTLRPSLNKTHCKATSPSLVPTDHTFPAHIFFANRSCNHFQHEFINCAHGVGMENYQPQCPSIEELPDNPNWLEDIWIVVPNYPWPMNIFHFASTATDISRTISSLPSLRSLWKPHGISIEKEALSKVHILFQGEKLHSWFGWQNSLLDNVIVRRNIENGINVSLHYLPEMKTPLCLRHAVMLGKKGHVNMWPYLNMSDVPLDGMSVPNDAVRFKRTAFDTFRINASLPSENVAKGVVETPPLVIGYAKRDGKPDKDGYYRLGASRRFGEDDERWFKDMLKNETQRNGVKLVTFSFVHGESLEEQVRTIADIGFIVGIHGANLVNAMFMRPFGAFMEIFPNHEGHALSRCYIGGGNAGLKYLRLEARSGATAEESGCAPDDEYCAEIRQRRVVITDDRERIRNLVREGIEHLKELRRKYPSGIPVRLNTTSEYFDAM